MERIVLDIVLFASALLMPWWVTLPLALFLVFRFDFFYEGIVALFVVDIIFGGKNSILLNIPFLLTLVVTTLFLIAETLKGKLRLYPKR